MVKALILSYNALPMDVVSSYRAKAYCDHLSSFDVRPTLLTHRWEPGDNGFLRHRPQDNIRFQETENYSIIRLPYPGMQTSPSSFQTFLSFLDGNLDVELLTSYRIYKRFLWDHLKQHHYDVIIAIYNPHFHLKLAYQCFRKFGIPYVLDFRDLWDNEVITPSYRPTPKKRLVNFVVKYWWKRWISNSLFFTTTGQKWQAFLSALSGQNGIVVRNGFDCLPETPACISQPGKPFKVIHFGRMYKTQMLDTFLKGFKAFACNFSPHEVQIEIIGLKKTREVDFESIIVHALKEYVTIKPYMSKEELMTYCKEEAALFFFPNFREDNGSFAVKIYDYAMMGKNILVTPDGGQVSEFVRDTTTGVAFDRPEEVTNYLHRTYDLFRKDGFVPFNADRAKLNQYLRWNQVGIMAKEIHSALKGKR